MVVVEMEAILMLGSGNDCSSRVEVFVGLVEGDAPSSIVAAVERSRTIAVGVVREGGVVEAIRERVIRDGTIG